MSLDFKSDDERILYFTHLFLDGMSIQDIVDFVDDSSFNFWIVYNDLTLGLSRIDIELFEKVSDIMNSNRLNNFKK